MLFRPRHGTTSPAGSHATVIGLAEERLRRRREAGRELTGADYLPLLLAHGIDDMILAEQLARTANALRRHLNTGGTWTPSPHPAPRAHEDGSRHSPH